MKKVLCTVAAVLMLFTVASVTSFAAEQKTYTFKISIDTTPNHHRTMGLFEFVKILKEVSKGRVEAQLFDSGSLYKDKDVPKALALGTLDMGVPGSWQLEAIEPDVALISLPMFSGRDASVLLGMVDGDFGALINKKLEKKLKVKMLPGYLGHGPDILWSRTKPLKQLKDFQGMKLRHRGGYVFSMGLKALGANPIVIAFTDVPMSLVQGTIDGLATTKKSFESMKFWETGTKYAFDFDMINGFYLGMINEQYWNSLPADVQEIILTAWKKTVPIQRNIAKREFENAEKVVKEKGVSIYYPSQKQKEEFRKILVASQDEMVKASKIDKALYLSVKERMDAMDKAESKK